MVGVHRYNERKLEEGRREVRAQISDSLLHVQQAVTARAETVYVAKVQHFTKTVTQWKTDTIREQILALPDTSMVPVREYRRLSGAMDSVVTSATAAIAAADSIAKSERAEKLLWRAKAEHQTPTIIYPPPDRWKQRGKGFVGGLVVAGIAYAVTR